MRHSPNVACVVSRPLANPRVSACHDVETTCSVACLVRDGPDDVLIANFSKVAARVKAIAARGPRRQRKAVQPRQAHCGARHTLTIHKPASSSGREARDGIAIRKPDRRTDHEVELAFVIGKQGTKTTRGEALGYVADYAIGLDVMTRNAMVQTPGRSASAAQEGTRRAGQGRD